MIIIVPNFSVLFLCHHLFASVWISWIFLGYLTLKFCLFRKKNQDFDLIFFPPNMDTYRLLLNVHFKLRFSYMLLLLFFFFVVVCLFFSVVALEQSRRAQTAEQTKAGLSSRPPNAFYHFHLGSHELLPVFVFFFHKLLLLREAIHSSCFRSVLLCIGRNHFKLLVAFLDLFIAYFSLWVVCA